MINRVRTRFTKWYVKKGYTFDYDFSDTPIIGDDIFRTPCGVPRAIWKCPLWVRPFLFLFSPSTYSVEAWGKAIVEGMIAGMKNAGIDIDTIDNVSRP